MRASWLVLGALAIAGCGFEGAAPTDGTPAPDGGQQPSADAAVDADPTDPDRDNDGVANEEDNCPDTANLNQENEDLDSFGNACDVCPHLDDPDQADADLDGVGDDCDPQPGLMNSWLFFTGFDAPLVGDDWVGETGFDVIGGELRSQNNLQRYYLRNTTINHGDNAEIGLRVTFTNPLGPNGVNFRFGGPLARAEANTNNNGCWMVRALTQQVEGYTFVETVDANPLAFGLVETTLLNQPIDIKLSVKNTDYDCTYETSGQAPITVSRTTTVNQDGRRPGFVSSYIDSRVPYLYAISLQ